MGHINRISNLFSQDFRIGKIIQKKTRWQSKITALKYQHYEFIIKRRGNKNLPWRVLRVVHSWCGYRSIGKYTKGGIHPFCACKSIKEESILGWDPKFWSHYFNLTKAAWVDNKGSCLWLWYIELLPPTLCFPRKKISQGETVKKNLYIQDIYLFYR